MEIATSASISDGVASKVEAYRASRAEAVCDLVIEKSLLAIVSLVPLALSNFTEEWFALPKATVLRLLTAIALVAWLAKGVSTGRFLVAKTWLDVPILAYLLVSFIATLTSVSIHLSLFSTVFRQDGVITLANYVILFYIAVTTLRREDKILRFLQFEVLIGIPVALLGIAQHFGFVFWDINPNYFGEMRVFSTIGNPGFLGGYLIILLPLALVLATTSRAVLGKGLWVMAIALLTICLVYTYTRGAWIGIGVAAAALVCLSRRRLFRMLPWVILSTVLVTASIQGEQKGLFDSLKSEVKASGGTDAGEADIAKTLNAIVDASGGTGEIRMLMWRGALGIIRDYPILGTGPNTFLPMFSKYAPIEYTRGEGLDRFPDKPHNAYLEIAVGTGIFGLIAFLSILFVFGWKGLFWVWRAEGRRGFLGIGLLSSWVGFLAYLFFLFFVIDTGAIFWLNMALLLGLMQVGETGRELRFGLPQAIRPIGYVAALAVGIFLAYLSLRPLVADVYMREARNTLKDIHTSGNREGIERSVKDAKRLAELAIKWNPYEVSYYTKMAGVVDVEVRTIADPREQREKLDEAVAYYTKAIAVNPRMASIYYMRGAGYEAYGDDHLRDALADFEKSVELYPYFYNGNVGIATVAQRLGLMNEAIVAGRRLAELFPHYTDNLINLGANLYMAGRYQEAITEWDKILRFEPNNAGVRYRIAQAYATIGGKERAIAEYRRVLEIDPKMTAAQKALDILEGRAQSVDD